MPEPLPGGRILHPLSLFEEDQRLGIPFFIGNYVPLAIGGIWECEGQRFRVIREVSRIEVEKYYRSVGRELNNAPYAYEAVTD